MNNLIRKLIKFLITTSIYTLVYSAIFIPMTIILGWAFLVSYLFVGEIPDKYNAFVVACSMFISGLGGLAQIIRKEAPGLLHTPIRGVWPIVSGFLWLIFTWSLSLLLFYHAFSR